MILKVVLIVAAIIVIIGIIRIIVKPPKGFWEFFLDLTLLDLLFDILGAIFENLDL
jgi:hypothetical protein